MTPTGPSPSSLHLDKEASKFYSAHEKVVQYHLPGMERRETCYNFVKGWHWTDDEKEIGAQKGKALFEFNRIKPSERTFIGALIQQKYDVKPAPREPSDQDKSDVYSAMYHYTRDAVGATYHDINLIREAWAAGNAWQESYVATTPGRKPRIVIENQDSFLIFPDPGRRDLVYGSDCRFIDRERFMSRDEILSAWPKMESLILERLPEEQNAITYEKAVRTWETKNFKNGKHRVIERFYKVTKRNFFGVKGGQRMDLGADPNVEQKDMFRKDYPQHDLVFEPEEFLYYAAACPDLGGEFLYNGEYHCQPRYPSGKIMFPLVELVDEELDGVSYGHVEPQIGPNKIIDSLMVNVLYAAKNASSQAHIGERDMFDPDVILDISENLHDGKRVFWKKKGAGAGPGISIAPMGGTSADSDKALNFTMAFQDESSSTPPSMKGFSEGNVAGVLNKQRIEQSYIQQQVFNQNHKRFLIARAMLWKYYWKEYYDAEEVMRVLERKSKDDPEYIKINAIVQDEFGGWRRENTFGDADNYDMVFEDSFMSPTVKDKTREQISGILQTMGTGADPVLNAYLQHYMLMLSDAPQEMKTLFKEHSSAIKQFEDQKRQMEMQEAGLDQAETAQNMQIQASQPQPQPQGA